MGIVITINRTVTDFVAKTRHLSVEDRGAYQELLDQIVILGQDYEPPSLPDDDRVIANILGWSPRKWRITKQRLCEGPEAVLIAEGGRLSQTRIVEEIEAARVRIAASSKAGIASGEARRKLSERMSNARSSGVERTLNGRGNAEATPSERRGNADPNGSRTSHESRVTSHELKDRVNGAREGSGTPDFEAAARVYTKLGQSALKEIPPEQIAVALLSEFGEELIVETLEDCEGEYTGKPWRYFERILVDRRDHPEKRPAQRRARRNDGNGFTRGKITGRKPPVTLAGND